MTPGTRPFAWMLTSRFRRRRQCRKPPPESLVVLRVSGELLDDQRIDALNLPRGGGDAVLGKRMRHEPGFYPGRRSLPLIEQDPEHLRDTARIDACTGHVPNRIGIRLGFRLAAVAREVRRAAHLDGRLCSLAFADTCQHARQYDTDIRRLRPLHLIDRMPERDVGDLVSENAGEHGHVLGALDQPAIDVDEPTGHRESVDLAAVHDEETPLQAPVICQPGNGIANNGDVAVGFGVPYQRNLRVDLGRVLRAHLHFLLRGYPARRRRDCQRRDRETLSHCPLLRDRAHTPSGASAVPVHVGARTMKLLTLTRDLQRRKARERLGLFVTEGVRTSEELLRSTLQVEGAIVSPALSAASRGAELRAALEERSIPVQEVSERELASAADTESPQGVLLVGRIPVRRFDSVADLPRSRARLLVLDAVQDPGNAGTLVRTAAALGVTATIALPGTVDLWNAKVVRSAMGSLFRHPAIHATWDDLDEFLRRSGAELWGADAAGDRLGAEQPPDLMALAVGNEGAGLTPTCRARVSRLVAVPIAADVESLNVGVAAGIILHHLRP